MNLRRGQPQVLLGAAALVIALSVAQRGTCQAQGEARVLVLRNGNVLEGAVHQHGEYFRVEVDGAMLQVPSAQVDMACNSLVEAYEARRANRVGSSSDARLELARWCIRHNLLEQGEREILEVRAVEPGHPRLAVLQSQLQQLIQLRQTAAQTATNQTSATAATAPEMPPAISAASAEISIEAQAQFVRSVQPMLIHSCATGGCHQPGAGLSMSLDRWALDGNGNATLIRRNLAAVLEHVDRQEPAASRLLLMARQPHSAPNARPSTPLASRQATILLEWLIAATGYQAPPAATDAAAAPGQVAPASMLADPSRATRVDRAIFLPSSLAPRDAFDPVIFKQRLAAEKAKHTAARGTESQPAIEKEAALEAGDSSAATEQSAQTPQVADPATPPPEE